MPPPPPNEAAAFVACSGVAGGWERAPRRAVVALLAGMPPGTRDPVLPKPRRAAILVPAAMFRSSPVPAIHSSSEAPTTDGRRRERPVAFAWLPAALLGVGLVLGLGLWSKWGFAIAFEAIRSYCF
jgi:hypothetical protein